MSIHCLICGHTENWRDSGEVDIDDKTWVVVKIFRDSLSGEEKPNQRALDRFWAHRDCIINWLDIKGFHRKMADYNPQKIRGKKSPGVIEKCKVQIGFECDGDKEIRLRCEKCGQRYCENCASTIDYECGCVEPPKLKRVN